MHVVLIKMQIKEIYVEVKKSRNYQTYTAGETIVLEEGEAFDVIRNKAMARCRKAVMEQIEIDAQ